MALDPVHDRPGCGLCGDWRARLVPLHEYADAVFLREGRGDREEGRGIEKIALHYQGDGSGDSLGAVVLIGSPCRAGDHGPCAGLPLPSVRRGDADGEGRGTFIRLHLRHRHRGLRDNPRVSARDRVGDDGDGACASRLAHGFLPREDRRGVRGLPCLRGNRVSHGAGHRGWRGNRRDDCREERGHRAAPRTEFRGRRRRDCPAACHWRRAQSLRAHAFRPFVVCAVAAAVDCVRGAFDCA